MIMQLPLGISLHDDLTFANFIAGQNRRLVGLLSQMARGEDERLVYIWGDGGSGKTHLLQSICNQAVAENKTALYIPFSQQEFLSTKMLDGIEGLTIACIDDIDMVAKDANWEEALFHLFNRVRESDARLVISSKLAPNKIPFNLKDLKSRIAWFMPFKLEAIGDEQKIMAMQLRARARGFDLDSVVGKFLLSRCPRNMHSLFEALEKLDFASLSHKRKLTIPFAKDVLGF